jgi:hypothetical protein
MSLTRSFIRWLPTFLGFPLGGLVAVHVVGSVDGPLTALLAGAVAGTFIGAAQWLALRSLGIGLRWAVHTGVGMAVGSSVAAAVTDAGTAVGALVLTGLIAGAAVGAAQGAAFNRGWRIATVWTGVTSLAWALGWWATANVIVDAERGYVTFGASGALLATALTGLAPLVVRPPRDVSAAPASVAHPVEGADR